MRDMNPTKGGDRAEAERVIALMVLAAWADGRVEGSEAFAIQRLVSANPLLAHLRPISAIADETRERLREKGMDACLAEACAALGDRTYRELAFQCCAKVMGADRAFPLEEESVLKKLEALLGLESAEAERLLVLATR
jgi:tellurite resistance protein